MGDADGRLFDDLAERLREAHHRVAAIPAGDRNKPAIIRRLLAISDSAKQDLARASRRLDALLAELDDPPA